MILIPKELRWYHGCRAGTMEKARLKAKHCRCKPSIPCIMMGNVNSLVNKTDKLAALVKNVRINQEGSVM